MIGTLAYKYLSHELRKSIPVSRTMTTPDQPLIVPDLPSATNSVCDRIQMIDNLVITFELKLFV